MSHDNIDLAEILRKRGYRMTPQRQMVLDAVCESGGHVAPERIYEAVNEKSEAVNRATVYRILKFLREIQLVTATASPDGHLLYEIASGEPHHHLLCRKCGADLELPNEHFSRLWQQLFSEFGFRVEEMHVTFQGLCADCQGGRASRR
jgi:Fur family transcriptional regulator, ferric uptake regulator